MLITVKSHDDLVSAPPLFFENDAPASQKKSSYTLQIPGGASAPLAPPPPEALAFKEGGNSFFTGMLNTD